MVGSRRGPTGTAARAGAVLAAALATLAGLAIALAPGALAAPRLALSDTTIHVGQTVTVTGSGFPSKPTSLYITICANPPGATNCDVNLSHVTQVQYDGSGGFRTRYTVAVTRFASAAGSIDCATTQCVIGSTNALDPKDRSYNAVALFTVAAKGSGGAPSPKPSKSTPGTTGSSTPAAAGNGPSTLPRTGATPTTPLVATAGAAAVLAGALLLAGATRRRGSHSR